MNLVLFFEGTGQGVTGKFTNVTRLNPTFHVRKQNPSGCWGFVCRSSLHCRFGRFGSFA